MDCQVVDYRALLKRYIRHVINSEGVMFVEKRLYYVPDSNPDNDDVEVFGYGFYEGDGRSISEADAEILDALNQENYQEYLAREGKKNE